MQTMLREQYRRKKLLGKDTTFFFKGRRVENKKLSRYAQRKNNKDLKSLESLFYQWQPLPSEITCQTPPVVEVYDPHQLSSNPMDETSQRLGENHSPAEALPGTGDDTPIRVPIGNVKRHQALKAAPRVDKRTKASPRSRYGCWYVIWISLSYSPTKNEKAL